MRLAAEARSLKRPPAGGGAVPPAVGELAPVLPGIDLQDGRPRIVAFLRHVGCPFAEATLRSLREAATAEPAVEFLAVTHSGADVAAAWADRAGGAGAARLVSDPARRSYAAWGLGRTSLRHFAGARSLREAGRLARRGVRNTPADGTRWQRAGTFAVGAGGRIRAVHLPAHAGDVPDLRALAAAARR
jgi:hypothetical protein